MNLWAVVVAAGSGSRFGGPKHLARLGERRVIDWSVAAMARVSRGVVVVGAAEGLPAGVVTVSGGATRSESVRAGLAAVSDDATHVLIHDGARPLVSDVVVDRVVAALSSGADAVVPVVPVVDSLRSVDGHAVDRSRYVAVQTPQGFDIGVIRQAHSVESDATDDATLVDQLGLVVRHVDGDPKNLKITRPVDLAAAEAWNE